jgi:hypothetical protein
VIVPGIGAVGAPGAELITTDDDDCEVHPALLVTVKIYVPAVNPVRVVLDPVPVIPPGLMVQFPAGNPFKTTLPVGSKQVGCVMVPIVGVFGTALTLKV